MGLEAWHRGMRRCGERLRHWKTGSGTKRFRPIKKKGGDGRKRSVGVKASTWRPMAGDLIGNNFEIYTSRVYVLRKQRMTIGSISLRRDSKRKIRVLGLKTRKELGGNRDVLSYEKARR